MAQTTPPREAAVALQLAALCLKHSGTSLLAPSLPTCEAGGSAGATETACAERVGDRNALSAGPGRSKALDGF